MKPTLHTYYVWGIILDTEGREADEKGRVHDVKLLTLQIHISQSLFHGTLP